MTSKQTEHKFKLYNRLLISYNDFKQAHEISSYLIETDAYKNYPQENRTLIHGMNLAAIIAYSRPFTSNRGLHTVNKLPPNILDVLTTEEIDTHKAIIFDRNTIMAHSDADENKAYPGSIEINQETMVLPLNAAPYAKPLRPECMNMLGIMAFKLQEEVFSHRVLIENEIKHLI